MWLSIVYSDQAHANLKKPSYFDALYSHAFMVKCAP